MRVGDEEKGVEHAPRSLRSDRTVAPCIRKEDPGERSCRSGTMGSVSECRLSVLPEDEDWGWTFAGASLGLRRDGLQLEI